MTRSAEANVPAVPARMCVGCRRSFAKPHLLRFVRHGDRIVADRSQRLPGRGGYVCERLECRRRALEKDAARLRRALRLGSIRATVDEEAVRTLRPRLPLPQGRPVHRTPAGGADDNEDSGGGYPHQGVCT